MKVRILLVMMAVSPNAAATSFDCSQASTLVEQVICSNKQLSDLDDSLAAAYKDALSASNSVGQIRVRQREWLVNERNRCQDITCIRVAYTKRLAELSSPRRTTLKSGNDYVVPTDQEWVITEFSPYKSEKGIGTADLYIDGNVIIDSKYSLSGKFDFTLSSGTSEPIIIFGGSKITVGDSRGEIIYQIKNDQPISPITQQRLGSQKTSGRELTSTDLYCESMALAFVGATLDYKPPNSPEQAKRVPAGIHRCPF